MGELLTYVGDLLTSLFFGVIAGFGIYLTNIASEFNGLSQSIVNVVLLVSILLSLACLFIAFKSIPSIISEMKSP